MLALEIAATVVPHDPAPTTATLTGMLVTVREAGGPIGGRQPMPRTMSRVTDTDGGRRAAVLVPVKSFRQAKARLARVLSPAQREQLARWSAERVLRAAAPLPVYVVCDDTDVAEWSSARGAEVVWRPGVGLNAAVDLGLAELAQRGHTDAVVAHSDLPLAHDLPAVLAPDRVVLIPDARNDGTNVVATPLRFGFRAAYGVGSFERHLHALRQAGVPVDVRADPLLAIDIDTADDLSHPLVQEVLPEWLRTNPANHA